MPQRLAHVRTRADTYGQANIPLSLHQKRLGMSLNNWHQNCFVFCTAARMRDPTPRMASTGK